MKLYKNIASLSKSLSNKKSIAAILFFFDKDLDTDYICMITSKCSCWETDVTFLRTEFEHIDIWTGKFIENYEVRLHVRFQFLK